MLANISSVHSVLLVVAFLLLCAICGEASSNVTLVSALFEVASKRPFSVYLSWVKRIFLLGQPVLMFCGPSRSVCDQIEYVYEQSVRESKLHVVSSDLRLIHVTFASLRVSRYEALFRFDAVRDHERRLGHSFRLFMLWSEKPEMLFAVAQQNPFNSTHFYWIDAGFIRSDESLQRIRPNGTVWPSCTTAEMNERVLLLGIVEPDEATCHGVLSHPPSDVLRFEEHSTGGGFFGGTLHFVAEWRENFWRTLHRFIAHGHFIGNDQNVILAAALSRPDLVSMYLAHNTSDYFPQPLLLTPTVAQYDLMNLCGIESRGVHAPTKQLPVKHRECDLLVTVVSQEGNYHRRLRLRNGWLGVQALERFEAETNRSACVLYVLDSMPSRVHEREQLSDWIVARSVIHPFDIPSEIFTERRRFHLLLHIGDHIFGDLSTLWLDAIQESTRIRNFYGGSMTGHLVDVEAAIHSWGVPHVVERERGALNELSSVDAKAKLGFGRVWPLVPGLLLGETLARACHSGSSRQLRLGSAALLECIESLSRSVVQRVHVASMHAYELSDAREVDYLCRCDTALGAVAIVLPSLFTRCESAMQSCGRKAELISAVSTRYARPLRSANVEEIRFVESTLYASLAQIEQASEFAILPERGVLSTGLSAPASCESMSSDRWFVLDLKQASQWIYRQLLLADSERNALQYSAPAYELVLSVVPPHDDDLVLRSQVYFSVNCSCDNAVLDWTVRAALQRFAAEDRSLIFAGDFAFWSNSVRLKSCRSKDPSRATLQINQPIVTTAALEAHLPGIVARNFLQCDAKHAFVYLRLGTASPRSSQWGSTLRTFYNCKVPWAAPPHRRGESSQGVLPGALWREIDTADQLPLSTSSVGSRAATGE